jgi:SH3-like domain-containing protein
MQKSQTRILFFSLLLISGIFGLVRSGTAEEVRLRIIAADASIRLAARSGSAVVSKVKLGAVLTSETKAGEWYRVDLPPDEDGYVISGFVHQGQVEVIGEAAVVFDAPKKIRVSAENAEIREGPTSGSREMGQAARGTELEAVEMAGEWYKVEVAAGIYGYVHQAHVEAVGPSSPQEYPVREAVPAPQDKPQDPVPAAPRSAEGGAKRKFSLKLSLGGGFGFEKIATNFYKIQGESSEEIIISPGGGGSFALDLGYYLTRELKLELGIGYQNSGVFASNRDEISFTRMPLTLTLLYEFPSPKSLQVYAGGGAGLYNAPEMKFEVGNESAVIKYGSSFGLHGLVGAVTRSKSGKWFYFGELRYVGVFNYKWTEARANGYSFIPLSKYQEFGGNGIFVLFGIGFYF